MFTPTIIYVRHNQSSPAAKISPSVINYEELTIVIKGRITYFVNDSEYTLEDGDAILLHAKDTRARLPSSDNADYLSFNFTTPTPFSLPTLIKGPLSREIHLLIASCDEILSRYISCEAQLSHILSCILLSLEANLKKQSLHPLVSQISSYLHENLSKKITLSDIGEHTFFSSVYCDTVFKREMGVSIIDYLLSLRIDTAKQLLFEGSLSLGTIAEAVGFTDYNYFSRTFKKRTGYSPVQYKHMLTSSYQGK